MSHTKICRYCGNVIPKDTQTCEYCGRFLYKKHDNPDLYCKKCKSPVNTDDNYCQHCGAIFSLPPEDIVNNNNTSFQHNISGIPYNIGIFLTSIAVSIAAAVVASVGKDIGFGQICVFWGVAFIAAEIFLYIYFLPSIIAIENNHTNTYFIYVCNLLFGITIIGWFIVLVFALNSKKNA